MREKSATAVVLQKLDEIACKPLVLRQIPCSSALMFTIANFTRQWRAERVNVRLQCLCSKCSLAVLRPIIAQSNQMINSLIKGWRKKTSSSFYKYLGTFRSEEKDDYEYEVSVLSMRIRFRGRRGRHFLKCACSEWKTRSRSRPRPPI